jgi:hypothetical protein
MFGPRDERWDGRRAHVNGKQQAARGTQQEAKGSEPGAGAWSLEPGAWSLEPGREPGALSPEANGAPSRAPEANSPGYRFSGGSLYASVAATSAALPIACL